MKANYNLNFHQKFSMETRYISSILRLPESSEGYTKEEISEVTGIPTGISSGKVVPHIEYAKYCNLINYSNISGKFKIVLTDLGKLILKEDGYLKENLTLDLLSYFITSNYYGADQFYYMFRELLSDNFINKKTIQLFLKERYKKNNEISNTQIINTMINLDSNSIEESEDSLKINYKKFNKEYIYAYAYTLVKEIEDNFEGRKEVEINEIANLKWKEGYFLSEKDWYKVLEILDNKKIIKLNKQLSPVTVLFVEESNNILCKIYSELL